LAKPKRGYFAPEDVQWVMRWRRRRRRIGGVKGWRKEIDIALLCAPILCRGGRV
jgi:hypothetical protein